MLQQVFNSLVLKSTNDLFLCNELWQEIHQAYSHPARHYHNLIHLENLIQEMKLCRNLINDYDTVLYSIFYHDIVYDVLQHDNEEQSAVYATKNLASLGLEENRISKCAAQIKATKTHSFSDDGDTDLFTDADLSILGKDSQTYIYYTIQVRKEYRVYPDEIYIAGRAKVLEHFLNREQIYKTDFFGVRYEEQARRNLSLEREGLLTRLQ